MTVKAANKQNVYDVNTGELVVSVEEEQGEIAFRIGSIELIVTATNAIDVATAINAVVSEMVRQDCIN